MRMRRCCTSVALAVAMVPAGLAVSSTASADCTNAGAATVCAQGAVRGGGPDAPVAGPTYPSYCADPWYCDDGWDVDIIWDPGRPGRPGGGGGIGPRR